MGDTCVRTGVLVRGSQSSGIRIQIFVKGVATVGGGVAVVGQFIPSN